MTTEPGALPPNRINRVAEHAVLEGTLWVQGDVQIGGRVIGAVEATAQVVVTATGVVEGDLLADTADVAGAVEGDLGIAGRLVLRSGARVEGAIKAGKLVVEDGAVFNGSCEVARREEQPLTSDRSRRSAALASPNASPRRPLARPSADRSEVPATAPARRKADFRGAMPVVLGVLAVLILATGTYYSLDGISDGTGGGPPPEATSEPETEAQRAPVDGREDGARSPLSETPALPDAPVLGDHARQSAGLHRIAMEHARQQILPQRTALAVATLYPQGEAARQAGLRRHDAGDFEEAARSFRAARALYVRMQQVLGDAGQEEPADTTTVALADVPPEDAVDAPAETPAGLAPSPPADTTAPPAPDSAAPVDGVPEDEAALEAVRTVVGRLARQLELTIEQEDAAGMGALYYRGWESFFEEAEAITAVVRPENVRLTGAEARADVYLDLAYQGAQDQPQRETRAHGWTLMRLGDEWVLRKVASL